VPGRLDGTVALVTGASSGIGEATALALAAEGAAVAVAARRRDRLDALAKKIEGDGGRVLVSETDVTDEGQAKAAVEDAVQQLGRLDIVVNNAGLMLLGPIVGADTSEWTRMVELNVLGLMYVTAAALPHLQRTAQQEPRRVSDLVNVSSVAGRVARLGTGAYNATKWAVNAFSGRCGRRSPSSTSGSPSSSPGPWRPSWPATTAPRSSPPCATASGTSSAWMPTTSPTPSPTW